MAEIPKRQDWSARVLRKFDSEAEMVAELEAVAEEELAHEHAVAKRAVEMLRATIGHYEYNPYFDNAETDNSCQCAGHKALRDIELSGWKP